MNYSAQMEIAIQSHGIPFVIERLFYQDDTSTVRRLFATFTPQFYENTANESILFSNLFYFQLLYSAI